MFKKHFDTLIEDKTVESAFMNKDFALRMLEPLINQDDLNEN